MPQRPPSQGILAHPSKEHAAAGLLHFYMFSQLYNKQNTGETTSTMTGTSALQGLAKAIFLRNRFVGVYDTC